MSQNAEFDAIIANLQDADLAAAAAMAAQVSDLAAERLRDNGVCYVGDSGTESVYAMRRGGTTLFLIRIDNAKVFSIGDAGKNKAPKGTAHPIAVSSVDGGKVVGTNGFAIRRAHKDGVHIDGATVTSFMTPRRVARFMSELY